jgi:predicted kinase
MSVIILVGVPGSGKSTIAEQYEKLGWKVINQDILGSRGACLRAMESALMRKTNVIVDRTNINAKQRKYFLDLIKIYQVSDVQCLVLVVPDQVCLTRIDKRENHPNITKDMPLTVKEGIIRKFKDYYEAPQLEEGFNAITYKSNINTST